MGGGRNEKWWLISTELFCELSFQPSSLCKSKILLLNCLKKAILCRKWIQFLKIGNRLNILFLKQFFQFSSAAQSYPTLCNTTDCSTPGQPAGHQLPEFTQTHVHWDGHAIQWPQTLSSPSPIFNLSQHQGLFQWVSSSHQVAKILEFQVQH